MNQMIRIALLAFAWSISCLTLAADPLPQPTGPVVLSVSGNISQTNQDGRADFDMSMLKALPQHEFDTTSPWTDGSHHYKGPLLSALLQRVGANGTKLSAIALNDYRIDINYAAVSQYPIIVALSADGKPMRVRDKGPIWILYPMSQYPELNTPQHHASMIWQLRSIEVR